MYCSRIRCLYPEGGYKCNHCRQLDLNDNLWLLTRVYARTNCDIENIVSIAMYLNYTDYAFNHVERAVRYTVKSVLMDMLDIQQHAEPRSKKPKFK